jgi:aminoglycoside phosphotransferase (APT) family kinase protein
MPSPTQLPREVQDWVESVIGAKVIAWQRVSGGLSRIAFAIETDATAERRRHLFLMMEGADQSGGNVHDAQVLTALNRLGACVPVFLGLHAASNALLMERLAGSGDFSRLQEAHGLSGTTAGGSSSIAGATIAHDLMIKMAYIHGLPLAKLELGNALTSDRYLDEQFVLIRRMQVTLGKDEFVEYGLRWLEAMRPPERGDRCLVHGDIGPGNFVFDEDRVTGIVDWEIAHAGDPMEDLAALSIRNLSKPIGDISELFAVYSQAAAKVLEVRAIEYFRIFILIRNSLLVRMKLRSADSSRTGADRNVARQLEVYEAFLSRCATECLAHWHGVDAARYQAGTVGEEGHAEQQPTATAPSFNLCQPERSLPYFISRAQSLCLQRSDLMGPLLNVHMPPLAH